MGIYINMEMPKDKAVSLLILTNGNVYKDGICFAKKAVSIPPHGRMIDADAPISLIDTRGEKVEVTVAHIIEKNHGIVKAIIQESWEDE